MSELKASLAPSGDVILSMSWDMFLELRAHTHYARQNQEKVHGPMYGASDDGRSILSTHLKWEVRMDNSYSSILPNVKSAPAGAVEKEVKQ